MWFKKRPAPEWFVQFREDLRTFKDSLPQEIVQGWEESERQVSLLASAPTPRHRDFYIEACPFEFDFGVGKLWTEVEEPSEWWARYVLAVFEAVRDGRCREARDRESGLTYHVFRLNSHGFAGFHRDSEYSMRHYLRRPVLKVRVHTVPAIADRPS